MEQESSNAALRKTPEETARELSHLFMVYVANLPEDLHWPEFKLCLGQLTTGLIRGQAKVCPELRSATCSFWNKEDADISFERLARYPFMGMRLLVHLLERDTPQTKYRFTNCSVGYASLCPIECPGDPRLRGREPPVRSPSPVRDTPEDTPGHRPMFPGACHPDIPPEYHIHVLPVDPNGGHAWNSPRNLQILTKSAEYRIAEIAAEGRLRALFMDPVHIPRPGEATAEDRTRILNLALAGPAKDETLALETRIGVLQLALAASREGSMLMAAHGGVFQTSPGGVGPADQAATGGSANDGLAQAGPSQPGPAELAVILAAPPALTVAPGLADGQAVPAIPGGGANVREIAGHPANVQGTQGLMYFVPGPYFVPTPPAFDQSRRTVELTGLPRRGAGERDIRERLARATVHRRLASNGGTGGLLAVEVFAAGPRRGAGVAVAGHHGGRAFAHYAAAGEALWVLRSLGDSFVWNGRNVAVRLAREPTAELLEAAGLGRDGARRVVAVDEDRSADVVGAGLARLSLAGLGVAEGAGAGAGAAEGAAVAGPSAGGTRSALRTNTDPGVIGDQPSGRKVTFADDADAKDTEAADKDDKAAGKDDKAAGAKDA